MDKKHTRFVKVESPKSESSEQTSTLAPYTNTCTFSIRLGENPTSKELNGYRVVAFSACHWQPKGKPVMWMQCYVYDEDLQKQTLQLKQGQSFVASGKLGYDSHQGIAKLYLFIDRIDL